MTISLELTGRTTTHVEFAPHLGSTLHREVIPSALLLSEAARASGIDLAIVSSFRSFDRQVAIWNAKFRGERPLLDRAGQPLDCAVLDERARVDAILLWSALPGASRHHWGTDIDVVDRAAVPAEYRPQLTVAEFSSSGPFVRLNDWLSLNMERFGFFRPYARDRGGVQPEPWHLSYAPVAMPMLTQLTVEVLFEAVVTSSMDGRETVLRRLPEIHERYVRNVD